MTMKLKESIRAYVLGSLGDPIVNILARNSHLTRIQLETLLIDVLADNISGKQLKYDEKAELRLTKVGISRGAFNRTLGQSKENIIKSIYTVLLLGYLGIFESTALDPYIEIANKLQEYVKTAKSLQIENNQPLDHVKAMKVIKEELENTLRQLLKPSDGIA